MNIETVLNSLLVSDTNSLGMLDIVFAIVLPFLLGFIVTFTYSRTQRHSNYTRSFIHSLFLFSCLTSIVTMIIGSNIARAFGLIGALSIIRFRNALKSPIDAIYIFWALVIGMACGTGFYFAAILLTLICSIIVFILDYSRYGEPKFNDSVVKISTTTGAEATAIPEVEKILASGAWTFRLLNVLFNSELGQKTYVYMLRAKRNQDSAKLEEAIGKVEGVDKIHHLNTESAAFIH